MNCDEYNLKLAEILDRLPVEFRSMVSWQAYDRGHSAGYEEVLWIADEIASNLESCIENYRIRLMKGNI